MRVHNQQFELTINNVLHIGDISVTVVDIDDKDVCLRIDGLEDFNPFDIQVQPAIESLRISK